MSAPPPRVLVVLLNFRTAQMTLRAAEAALNDMAQTEADTELVIVDNASGDGSDVVLGQAITDNGWDADGRVRLIVSPVNGGFGAGNNIGLHASMSDGGSPDYFYLLNSDAFPDPGCLGALIQHLQTTPKAGLVGSHVRGEDDVPHRVAFRFPSIGGEFEGAARLGIITRLLKHSVIAPEMPTQTAQMDWVVGASVLIRARTLDDIGHFDETFFLYFEETDLCRRAALAGWQTWYLPTAKVIHIGSVSTGMKEVQRMPAYWFASRRHYFVKNHGRLYAAVALAARLAGGCIHTLRSALGGRPRQDAPQFYTDLLRHGLGLSPKASKIPATGSVSEEK